MRPWPIIQMIGAIVLLVGVAMGLPAIVALGMGEGDALPLVLAALITVAVGAAVRTVARLKGEDVFTLKHKEGFAVVTIGWLAATLFGALPFFLFAHNPYQSSHLDPLGRPNCAVAGEMSGRPPSEIGSMAGAGWEFCSFSASFFESVSGFTTTGATILTGGLWQRPGVRGPRELPHGVLLWRSMTHWLGGMGIIVLSLAIFPLLGVGGMDLYKAEAPGPVTDKLMPRARETAKLLWKIYLVVTVAQIILLMLGGLTLYDSVIHTFGTVATGGFSNLALSAGGFDSPYVDAITILFMLVAGSSFSLHYYALFRQRPTIYAKDPEFRFYFGVLAIAVVVSTLFLYLSGTYGGPLQALRYGAFQVVSMATTTGFTTANYEAWAISAPVVPLLLFFLMFLGGCAGSTSGSIKCVRVSLLLKQGYWNLFHLVHPRAVHPLRLGDKVVTGDTMRAIGGFLALYLFLFFGAAILLAAMGEDLITSLAASAACVGNIGPGFGGVGPVENYHHIPVPGLWALSATMIMGRLEVYTVLVVLIPAFWKR